MEVLEAKEICVDFIEMRMEQKKQNISLSKDQLDINLKMAIEVYLDHLEFSDQSDGAISRAFGLSLSRKINDEINGLEKTEQIPEYEEFPVFRAMDLQILQGIQKKLFG